MSFTVAVIVIACLAVALLAALGFVMSRPRNLRPHREGWRRYIPWGARTPRGRPGAGP